MTPDEYLLLHEMRKGEKITPEHSIKIVEENVQLKARIAELEKRWESLKGAIDNINFLEIDDESWVRKAMDRLEGK